MLALAVASGAQAEPAGGTIAPLPEAATDSQQRIVPENPNPVDAAIMSTHTHAATDAAAPSALPWKKPDTASNAAPAPAPLPTAVAKPATPTTTPFGTYQPKVPFGHAEPTGPVVPSAPHISTAVPVGSVDAVESSEAAPPTPVAAQADPAKEDPADPTELTSPIFEPENGANWPRKLVLRVLNKVTGQSQLVALKPGENIKMGQLQITAVTCQTSAPRSQTDYAGLIDISEQRPGEKGMKALFRGWMYASSPSITALEHPVYDVTVVQCDINQPAPKKEAETVQKTEKKADKKAKK